MQLSLEEAFKKGKKTNRKATRF